MAILITAASFALAYKLERFLNETEVCFAEQMEMPAVPGKKFIRIPEPSSPIFTSELLKICLDNQICKIYPLKEAEIKELSNVIQLFNEYGISIIIHTDEWIL